MEILVHRPGRVKEAEARRERASRPSRRPAASRPRSLFGLESSGVHDQYLDPGGVEAQPSAQEEEAHGAVADRDPDHPKLEAEHLAEPEGPPRPVEGPEGEQEVAEGQGVGRRVEERGVPEADAGIAGEPPSAVLEEVVVEAGVAEVGLQAPEF
jgi:hypothetical protein